MKKILSILFICIFSFSSILCNVAADEKSFEEQVLILTNAERAKYGLQPLKGAVTLDNAAAIRAEEITSNFSHTRPNGTQCFTVINWQSAGYNSVAENIACGQRTPAEVVQGWMNSSGHRANILNGSYTHLGVGYVYKSGDVYGHYWSQFFGGTNKTMSDEYTAGSSVSNPITTEKPVVTTKTVTTQKVNTRPVVTTRKVTTQPIVTTQKVNTQPLVTTQKVTTQPVVTEKIETVTTPKNSTQPKFTLPEFSFPFFTMPTVTQKVTTVPQETTCDTNSDTSCDVNLTLQDLTSCKNIQELLELLMKQYQCS